MGYRVMLWLLAMMWISSFSTAEARKAVVRNQKQTLMDVYAKAVGQSKMDMQKFIDDKLTEQQTYGFVKPYVPVIQQPVVRKVWVPHHKSHNDPDVLVAGHWAYVMVEGPKWFIDSQTASDEGKEIIVPLQPEKITDQSKGQ